MSMFFSDYVKSLGSKTFLGYCYYCGMILGTQDIVNCKCTCWQKLRVECRDPQCGRTMLAWRLLRINPKIRVTMRRTIWHHLRYEDAVKHLRDMLNCHPLYTTGQIALWIKDRLEQYPWLLKALNEASKITSFNDNEYLLQRVESHQSREQHKMIRTKWSFRRKYEI